MKIAAVFSVYNEAEYIEYAVRGILPAVDRVIICLGLSSYTAYSSDPELRSMPDRTEAIVDRLADQEPKIRLIKGNWSNQLEHRDAGLKLCLEEGVDYYWLVDGDEVYREDHLKSVREEIDAHPEAGTFIIKCHLFWRSFRYRLPPDDQVWRPWRIFKLTQHRRILGIPFPHKLRFVAMNELNALGSVYEIHPKRAVFYHFSYARTANAMEDKIKTFPHAHEIRSGWFENVFRRWPENRDMENIHPTDPPKFPKAKHQSLDDLPEILKKHPYYELDIIP